MSPKTKNPITLYIKNGAHAHMVGKIDRRRAMYMSFNIKTQIQDDGYKPIKDPDCVIFYDIDLDAARAVMAWINQFDTYGDYANSGLTQDHVGSEEMRAILNLHAAAHAIGVARKMRGEQLHDD